MNVYENKFSTGWNGYEFGISRLELYTEFFKNLWSSNESVYYIDEMIIDMIIIGTSKKLVHENVYLSFARCALELK